ncbi:MAG: arginine repressor [Actinomycetota bacterium]|nr:arginine repressor [Actinomycetota bacterium]
MDKRTRHRIIKEIVAGQPIATQEGLVKALTERRVAVTQATVSRDIAEIPLQKVRTGAGLVYHWQGPVDEPAGRLGRMVREFVLAVDRSENLVLLKTSPGSAPAVAGSVDEARLEPVLATIAGDDTVLVVAKDKAAGGRAREMLMRMMEYF